MSYMTDMVLCGLPDELLQAIRRRADAHGVTPEEEAEAMLREAVSKERPTASDGTAWASIPAPRATGRGLGSELAAIGRKFGITTEFDNLRDKAPIDAARFD